MIIIKCWWKQTVTAGELSGWKNRMLCSPELLHPVYSLQTCRQRPYSCVSTRRTRFCTTSSEQICSPVTVKEHICTWYLDTKVSDGSFFKNFFYFHIHPHFKVLWNSVLSVFENQCKIWICFISQWMNETNITSHAYYISTKNMESKRVSTPSVGLFWGFTHLLFIHLFFYLGKLS